MTEEQSAIAESVPEVEGTWRILSAHSTFVGRLLSVERLPSDRITMSSGAWCTDSSKTAPWEAAALTNVVSFTHDAKPCGRKQPCDASMWNFDLAYPESAC